MRLSILALTSLMIFSISPLHADACADLFTAIQVQDIALVEKALAAGADTDRKGSIDGHSAKTFAFEQITTACRTPVPLIASSVAPLALVIASFLHNKNYALAVLAGLGTGMCASAYTQNTPEEDRNIIQKVTAKLHLDEVTTYASIVGLLASAWSSNQFILSSIGTAGLAILYYQGEQLKTACQIYKMVDPEHVLFPELA